jgi:hypothetical protein
MRSAGPETDVIHAPSSGFSYSDAEAFENEQFANPNIRYVPGENNRTAFPARHGPFSGIGPKGYKRPDERIYEDVCEALVRHPDIDASEISVKVDNGIVTLSGSVETRRVKRLAEEAIEDLFGIRDIMNKIRVMNRDHDKKRIGHSLN